MDSQVLTNLVAEAKLTLRITTNAFDSEVQGLLEAAYEDLLAVNAITETQETTSDEDTPLSALVKRALITYVKAYFGENEHAERYIKAYNELKAQLKTCTGYTDWSK